MERQPLSMTHRQSVVPFNQPFVSFSAAIGCKGGPARKKDKPLLPGHMREKLEDVLSKEEI